MRALRSPGVLMLAVLLAAWLALTAPAATAEVAVPVLKARVTDLTGTLSAQQRDELEALLAGFEAKKGSQIAVLLLPSTRPEEIEQYAIRVFDQWKVGRKGVDDGLLLVVAKDDRRLRIEVGYGLEGVIPDSVARRVIDETITPRFRANDFAGGVRAGAEQLMRLIEGEKLPPPQSRPAQGGTSNLDSMFEWLVPLFAFVVVGGGILKAVLGRLPGALAVGVVAGLAGWLMVSLGAAALFALVGFILTFVNTGGGRRGGGGWSSGGGGWSSGGSSSSWGGGGGSSGGGGASGSW
ncbi:MAG: TPM domain-containing protein [Betaproteobacteria bacterium]|nr:TPM domain-containing protein [Betaproteobacteria bacterium]